MKTKYFCGILLITILVASCKKETSSSFENETLTPNIKNGRLVFNTPAEFDSYTGDLYDKNVKLPSGFNSLQQTLDETYSTKEGKEVSTEIKDLLDFYFPPSYLAILNNKGEVRIGDEIVWYHGGKKYYIPIEKEISLEKIKLSPEKIEKFSIAGSKVIEVKDEKPDFSGSRRLYITPSGGLDARHQHEFNQVYPPSGGARKYVHEIRTFFDSYWISPSVYIWNAYISLYIKMEWKNSKGKWKPAGETRDVSVNISGQATINTPGQGGYAIGPLIQQNNSLQVNSDYIIPLAHFNGSGTLPSNAQWSLDLTGTIYQHVVGDISQNAWYNTGTLQSPLW
ncbi:hypothetical protein [Agriterribacter sp.]|uniref:hypothetical protein n=1 Tax=Agriterribacter sp. TaxID=2821509 RepID=UPI002B6C10EC|nr:hypothetical protein [Agriterribacter sp.]HTN05950.1 hypothetical protein [Agriterribacter sp.]